MSFRLGREAVNEIRQVVREVLGQGPSPANPPRWRRKPVGGGGVSRAVLDIFATADGLFKTFTDAPREPVLVLSFTRCSSGSVADDPTCSPTWSPGTDFSALADPGWFAKGWERTGGSASAYMPPSFSGWPSGGSGEWVYESSIGAWVDSGCDWIIWI